MLRIRVVFRLLTTTAVIAVLGCFVAAEQPISPTSRASRHRVFAVRHNDPVALLNARCEKGEVTLEHDSHWYLSAMLNALKVPASSRVLVFGP